MYKNYLKMNNKFKLKSYYYKKFLVESIEENLYNLGESKDFLDMSRTQKL